MISDAPWEAGSGQVAVGATLRTAALRRAGSGSLEALGADAPRSVAERSADAPRSDAPRSDAERSDAARSVVLEADLRIPLFAVRPKSCRIFVLDTSKSMGAERRITVAKEAALGLLLDAYQRREEVALVVFGGLGAEVLLEPTSSIEVARSRLERIPIGGRTPLAEGLRTARELAGAVLAREAETSVTLVVITDGRATAGSSEDPGAEALEEARAIARDGLACVVIDAEEGSGRRGGRLGLSRSIAEASCARLIDLERLVGSAAPSALFGPP